MMPNIPGTTYNKRRDQTLLLIFGVVLNLMLLEKLFEFTDLQRESKLNFLFPKEGFSIARALKHKF